MGTGLAHNLVSSLLKNKKMVKQNKKKVKIKQNLNNIQ